VIRYRWLLSVAALFGVALNLLITQVPPIEGHRDTSRLQVVGQVGGPTQAVATQGSYAYVGVGLRLVVLDVSDPAVPQEVGTTAPLPHFIEDVAISGTVAYVAAGGAGLWVLDVADPAHPIETGSWDSPGYAEGVAVAGNTVYLADGPYGLRVVDVSDPAHPTQVGFAYTLNYAFEVVVAGGYAYVAAAGAGLLVADISDPAHPIEVGTYDTPGYAYGAAVAGNTAYVADGWEGLRLVDVSNPSHPYEVGFYKTLGWPFGVAVVGNTAYVADAFGGLRVVDVSDRAHPTELGGYEVSGGHAGCVTVVGSMAYVTDRNWGLRVVNVSDPSAPTQVGFYGPLGYADAVAVSGSYAYIAAATYGLRVVDISSPAHPVEVGAYDTQSYATSVAVTGDHVYVATMPGRREDGLHVVDVSDPAQPTKVGYHHRFVGAYRDMAVTEDTAYIANEWGLEVISVTDPLNPTLIGFIDLLERPSCTVGVDIARELAYIAEEWVGLKIVDVSNPSNLSVIGVHDTPCYAESVAVAENFAYVADGEGLQMVDVSDPTHPVGLGFYDTPGWAVGVTISGGVAYVADGGGGLAVVDVSNPLTPILTDSYNTPGYSHEVTVIGDYVYVADGYGGLLILEWTSSHGSTLDHKPLPHAPSLGQSLRKDRPQSQTVGYHAPSGLAARCCRNGTDLKSISVQEMTKPVFSVLHSINSVPRSHPAPRFAGTCAVVSPADSGAGTLRWCLENAVSGDTVTFDPVAFPPTSPVSISLTAQLPPLTQGNLTIEASNVGVILDGSGAPEGDDGIFITSNGNTIKGLQIRGFHADGVVIKAGAQNNTIGRDRMLGDGPSGEGNVISSNSGRGIRIEGAGTANNTVIGNFIGTDASGMTSLGNGGVGVIISDGAQHNTIGPDNVIAYSSGAGIRVEGTTTLNNRITANSIHSNADKGIVTTNGGNGQLAPPVLSSATITTVVGTAPPSATVEIFSDEGGQGRLLEGSIIANVSGQFTFVKAEGLTGPRITATATDAAGNTSEFSTAATLFPETHVVTSTLDSGPGTLRQAMLGAGPGDTIAFAPSVFLPTSPVTIALTSGLPYLTQGNLTIDASNAGAILDGSNLPEGVNGLVITSDGNVIKGLQILGFPENGVLISDGARNNVIGGDRTEGNSPIGEGTLISGNEGSGVCIQGTSTMSNTIVGNYIGTDISGIEAIGNGSNGIHIGGASHNRIGGTTPGERNLISGNNDSGIYIGDQSAMSNIVVGNFIGTDASGRAMLGNQGDGVCIAFQASHNQIGGMTPGERNLISGNEERGVGILEIGTTGNRVVGNYVGTDVSGTVNLGNAASGISIELGASNNIIQGNVSSGNGECGINGNDWGVDYNIIIGNFVGTDATGTAVLGNDWSGVCICTWAAFNRVGGTVADERNVISGNQGSGVGFCTLGGTGNLVMGNFIGTDLRGIQDLANIRAGVWLDNGTRSAFIGGTTEGERNIISGNDGPGVALYGAGVEHNFIAGNHIGTNAGGTAALGNDESGVAVWDYAEHNVIRGNLISGNEWDGVNIRDDSSYTLVRANCIGIAADGASPLPNGMDGVRIEAASNTVGGPYPHDGNIIAFNTGDGVQVWTYPGNTMRRNSIYGNSNSGIHLVDGGNNLLDAPTITHVLTNLVSGTACPGCIVEIFSDEEDEGRFYEGSTIADTSGAFAFSKESPPIGPNIATTATDSGGNTSEFSTPRKVWREWIYLPVILKGQ